MNHAAPDYSIADLLYLNQLQFLKLTNDDAVELGLKAVEVIREWHLNLAVDVVLGADLVFRAKLGSSGPDNDPWLAGKAAAARHFGEPSLLVRLRHGAAGTEFTDLDLDHETMKGHGGSIPLRVDGEIVGTITTSGEPDVIDHEVAAEAISRYLNGT